jgi:cation diffusion facilitator family transporter
MLERRDLRRYALLSLLAALATMGLKAAAFWITGSVGLLSDALESGVNLLAALVALAALTVVGQPPDEEHAYGHEKAEYFSSGVEGGLILIAAIIIAEEAIRRLLVPHALARLNLGLGISVLASLVNLAVAQVLLRAGRRQRSIALEADARHLLSDVWTSAAVLLGVGLVAITGWQPLDPLVALGAAAMIAWMGVKLVRRSVAGLMDPALPESEVGQVREVLEGYRPAGIHYHALLTRQSGARAFVSFHVQVPGNWSVQRGHDLLEELEAEVRQALPHATVFTHIEPIEDPLSWGDQALDRAGRS